MTSKQSPWQLSNHPFRTLDTFTLLILNIFLLMKINARSIEGDLQNLCRPTNQNCAMDVNGHEA